MLIEKLGMSVEEQADYEYAKSCTERQRAVQDYNIMMGNLEDPSEEEEEEIDE